MYTTFGTYYSFQMTVCCSGWYQLYIGIQFTTLLFIQFYQHQFPLPPVGRETEFYIHMKLQVKLFCANCEVFRDDVFEGSILLGCEAFSLDNWFPTFRKNVALVSCRSSRNDRPKYQFLRIVENQPMIQLHVLEERSPQDYSIFISIFVFLDRNCELGIS